jgi:hypothetical protein
MFNFCLDDKIQKKVSINNIVSVILVPDITDYKNINLLKDIWYTSQEIRKIRLDALREINKHAATKGMSMKKAHDELYKS